MTQRSLAVVAFKVWGTVLLANSVLSLPSLLFLLKPPYQSATESSGYTVVLYQGLGLFLGVGLGLVFMSKAEPISARLLPSEEPFSVGVDEHSLFAVVLAVVGAAFAVTGLSGTAVTVYVVLARPAWVQTPALEDLWSQLREVPIRSALEFVLGLLLFFRSRRIVTLWNRVNEKNPTEATRGPSNGSDEDTES